MAATASMDDDRDDIAQTIQSLTDLELAALLCFVADQHCCLIEADESDLESVEEELQQICRHTFGLSSAVIDCSPSTTLDELATGILAWDDDNASLTRHDERSTSHPSSQLSRAPASLEDESQSRIADVIVATRLNEAPKPVQIQILELIRSKRLSTRTHVRTAPKNLLVIALVARGGPRLTLHLNDQTFISHAHLPNDPLPHLDGDRSGGGPAAAPPLVPPPTVRALARLGAAAAVHPDVRAQLHHVVVFLRTHRLVAGGVSATATRHFLLLARVLAPLHSLAYVPPALVALAARKCYAHRVALAADPAAVRAAADLGGGGGERARVDAVLTQVLEAVETPL